MKNTLFLMVVLGVGITATAGILWYISQGEFNPEFPPHNVKKTVNLYYYNPDLDKDVSGNIQCSREGLVAVKRAIPFSGILVSIRNTLQLLLSGELTQEERNQGITTEFLLEGVLLQEITLDEGVLTLVFDDLQNKTGGGSCRAGILWFQIEQTAKQFSGVQEVRFFPEWLFQP
ncbi:MAG: GerMN domain-containing protein [Candidatus Wildermuthbacteria bacterium]|nr:GerMN domain-containing protein [Candidatus Wildermuthbacteria bacterium]